MRFTALPPAPPTPTTFMRANWSLASAIWNTMAVSSWMLVRTVHSRASRVTDGAVRRNQVAPARYVLLAGEPRFTAVSWDHPRWGRDGVPQKSLISLRYATPSIERSRRRSHG